MGANQEKNKDTLTAAIRALPAYPAPPQIWVNIEESLAQREKLQEAIRELPEYQAPAKVWAQIEASLDNAPIRPGKIRQLSQRVKWLAAASVTGLIVCCAWWLINADPPAKTTLVYSEEIQLPIKIQMDWNAEEDAFAFVLRRVSDSPITDPAIVDRLKLEYHELMDARKEVEAMLKKYGKDTDLLQEISRIERERTRVIKQLAAWI